MNSWESLYHRAAGDYNSGNFEDSYDNYLKAANALLYKLNKEVKFASDAVKSKPNNSARLFQQLKSCVQKLEDILQNRTTNNVPSPRPSFTSDVATSILTNNPHPTYLPVIPFSPLTRQAINFAHDLATISQKVSVATQKSSENKDNLASLRKLNEELRQQRTKLDQVNSQIQSIAEVPLVHWDADAFAQQLTIIDSKLYSKVDFRKDLLSKDRKSSKAQACLDFHRYLTNSFAHQFIIYSEITRSSGNPPRGTSHPRDNIIAHAVRIAYLLLHVHRNFNSFAALMKSLTSPEVRRIRRLWVNLPNRVTPILKDLSLYVKNDNNYKVYNDALVQKVEDFREVGQGMIVIPWMQPHYEEIKTITQSYSSGKSGDFSDVILSAPGARKLESIFSLLERCQTNLASDDDEEWNTGRKGSPLTSRGSHQITLDGVATTLPTNLSCLGYGDLGLHHWVVSRVFLTKQQLIDESIEIEPLAENEQLPCVENDYEVEEEEEEYDRASVGQYDLGSDDSGDNMGATTSTTKSDIATGSTSQINSHEISVENLAKPEMSSLTTKTESNETSSKPTVNPNSVPSSEETPKLHENTVKAYSIKPTEGEESITQMDSIKPEPTDTNIGSTSTTVAATKTAAIPIPQSSQRTTTPLLSPASLSMAKNLNLIANLNPNAQVFIPRSQSFSSSTSATVQGAIDKINALTKESTEMGETSNSRKSISSTGAGGNVNNDDDDEFVYPGTENENENRSEDEFVYHPLEQEREQDDDEFVYDADTSNSVKVGEEDKNNGFPDPHQETSFDKDDGESKADSSFDTDRKDTVTKNGENSSSPNMGVDKVFTTVGESTDNSITVRLNPNAIGKDA